MYVAANFAILVDEIVRNW